MKDYKRSTYRTDYTKGNTYKRKNTLKNVLRNIALTVTGVAIGTSFFFFMAFVGSAINS